MSRFLNVAKISFGLTLITVSVLFIADFLGLMPNVTEAQLGARRQLAEVVAVSMCSLAETADPAELEGEAREILGRNPDLMSIAISKEGGGYHFATSKHAELWGQDQEDRPLAMRARVPLMAEGQRWGSLEMCFQRLERSGWLSVLDMPAMKLAAFAAVVGGILFTVYLRRVLRHLDPSTVIPERVKAAFDALAEGILVIDKDEQIVLANRSFADATGLVETELLGRRIATLPWVESTKGGASTEYPWRIAAESQESATGARMQLHTSRRKERIFIVNATPIVGAAGEQRGTLASFDDVTAIERKNEELSLTLANLEETRLKVEKQNVELKRLAMQDALTNCLNRRAFFEDFERHWSLAQRYHTALSCAMLDIDHFKSINDQNGHATGDRVLEGMAARLKSTLREHDVVCRYGGEEFCILFPHSDEHAARGAAEKLREAIDEKHIFGVSVTASIGISSLEFGAENFQVLIDEADRALYVAKRQGRNRVVSWKNARECTAKDHHTIEQPRGRAGDEEPEIPFHTVNAFLTALRHRDAETAEHAGRVADLCVMAFSDLMPKVDSYLLEVAALLHDIGKIGVPDSILLKPGPLTEAEWRTMELHDEYGVEIINAAFGSDELTNIIRCHHAYFDGTSRRGAHPIGTDIPLRARILAIVDAFDAMTSRRVYRDAMAYDAAFAELRRCAGQQFDAKLVEQFIQAYLSHCDHNASAQADDLLEAAICIGLEAERLGAVSDGSDYDALHDMAGRLLDAATRLNMPRIAELAAEVSRAAEDELDMDGLLEETRKLLELCYLSQEETVGKIQPDEAVS